MNINLFPKTKSGKFAIGISILFYIFILLQTLRIAAVGVPMLTIIGIGCFFSGIEAITAKGERALTIFLPIIAGLTAVVFLVSTLLF